MYASHWDGTSWTTYPTPNPGAHRNIPGDIEALTSTDIWVVGDYFDADGGPPHTLAEHWDGATWTRSASRDVGAFGSELSSVSAIAAARRRGPSAPSGKGSGYRLRLSFHADRSASIGTGVAGR